MCASLQAAVRDRPALLLLYFKKSKSNVNEFEIYKWKKSSAAQKESDDIFSPPCGSSSSAAVEVTVTQVRGWRAVGKGK